MGEERNNEILKVSIVASDLEDKETMACLKCSDRHVSKMAALHHPWRELGRAPKTKVTQGDLCTSKKDAIISLKLYLKAEHDYLIPCLHDTANIIELRTPGNRVRGRVKFTLEKVHSHDRWLYRCKVIP